MQNASFLRRLLAGLYDALLCLAIIICVILIYLLVTSILINLQILSIGNYKDVSDYLTHSVLYKLTILSIIVIFYIYFWLKSGQTLGMLVWKIKIVKGGSYPANMQRPRGAWRKSHSNTTFHK